MTTPSFTPENHVDALQKWRANVFESVIRFIAYAGTATYFLLIGVVFENLDPLFFVAYTVAYLLVLVSAFATRVPVKYRAYTVVILVYLLGVFASIEKAAMGDGRVWLVIAAVFAAIFLGRRPGLFFTIFVTVSWGVLGVLYNQGLLPKLVFDQYSLEIWGGTTVTLFMAGLSIVLSIGALLANLNQTISDGYALARKAEEQSNILEEQRNALQRRSNALERSARISRKIAYLTSSKDILVQAPIMIKNDFSLASVAFFSFDNDSRLHLVSSEGWNEQAYPRHDYSVALEEDISGEAVMRGEALSNQSGRKKLRPMLPETRSYAAIPMRGRSSDITGILLLQSAEEGVFGDERLATWQMLADQIAVLMENADLLAEKESALEAERRAYGDITQASWANFIGEQNYGGYLRNEQGLHNVPVKPYHPEENNPSCHQVPIQLRGRVIGYVDAYKPDNRQWTVSEKELLNTLAGRLENALDSARLYEEIQERATREHLVSHASTRMRERLDVQAVLQAAAEELHKALGDVTETEIWIAPADIEDDKAA